MAGEDQKQARHADKDVVLDRDDAGTVYAGVPRSVRHYGEDLLDWGYIGPATAELALNVLNWIWPPGADGEIATECEEGECSALAWRLHRAFMADFLVRVPYAGGCLREADVRAWVRRHTDRPPDPCEVAAEPREEHRAPLTR